MTLPGCKYVERAQASSNRDKIDRLRVGMTQREVKDRLGKPWKVDRYMSGDSQIEVLYYKTQDLPGRAETEAEMTPIFLKDAKVIGWGNRFVYMGG